MADEMQAPAAAPELKQVVGALIFGAEHPLTHREIQRCLKEVADKEGGAAAPFGSLREGDIRTAVDELNAGLTQSRCGFSIAEIAGGLRFQSDPACGKWLKHMLETEKPNRLSRPALETLAIIAYRQPVTRSEIEGVRGVNVDHIMRMLMEMQLVKISGRSELPGKPFQYGTTQIFLEHFGLRDLAELRSIDPALLAAREKEFRKKAAPKEGEGGAVAEAPGEDGEDVREPVFAHEETNAAGTPTTA